ncbi:hypothetical protein M9H77_04503 [Catharanthus roseus]|uniref:Uncharacterized protein n=1 Tax=Catharanthus roseus TaxID=4058 RepID=A0ACC0CEE6_CATRO|nr:hypothetical protein M9H77_04503 [Catharanthus roseus]
MTCVEISVGWRAQFPKLVLASYWATTEDDWKGFLMWLHYVLRLEAKGVLMMEKFVVLMWGWLAGWLANGISSARRLKEGWRPSPVGVMKINADGASKNGSGEAATTMRG